MNVRILKSICNLLILCFFSVTVQAFETCGGQEKLYAFHDNRNPAYQPHGAYGYKDAAGNVRISPQFKGMSFDFGDNGYAYASGAYINLAGERVYDVFPFDNGPDYFQEGLVRYTRSGKVGFLDGCMRVVIPAQFDFATPFRHGYSETCEGCREEAVFPGSEHRHYVGGKRSLINKKGERLRLAGPDELTEIVKAVYGYLPYKVTGAALPPENAARYDIRVATRPKLTEAGLCTYTGLNAAIRAKDGNFSLIHDSEADYYALPVEGECNVAEQWVEVSGMLPSAEGLLKPLLEMLADWQTRLSAAAGCLEVLGEDICAYSRPAYPAVDGGARFSRLRLGKGGSAPGAPKKGAQLVIARFDLAGCAIDMHFNWEVGGRADLLKTARVCMYQ